MKTYLLNTPVLTSYGEWKYEGPLDLKDARHLLEGEFISAIGHQSSADFLSQLIGINIPMNRIQVTMDKGDRAIVLRLTVRLPENVSLDKEQIEALPCELGLLTRLK